MWTFCKVNVGTGDGMGRTDTVWKLMYQKQKLSLWKENGINDGKFYIWQ